MPALLKIAVFRSTLKGIPGPGSAERCLRSRSRQVSFIAMKALAADTIFIGESDRLLAHERGHGHRQGFGVREAYEHLRGAHVPQERRAFFIEAHERLPALAVEDGDRFPAELGADARRKAF